MTSENEINEAFVDACANGDFKKAHYLLKEESLPYKASIFYNDTACFKLAFHYGHVDIIKYLSSSHELKEHIDVKPYGYGILDFARKTKDWKWLELLLPIVVDDSNQNFKHLINFSCRDGDWDTVNYLFNSNTWKHKIEVNDELYDHACYGGNVKIIDFLRKNFSYNISVSDDIAFLNAYRGLVYGEEYSEVIKYFISDLNVPYSINIKEYMEDDRFTADEDRNAATIIKKMFEARDLKNALKDELESNKLNQMKRNKL